MEALLPAEAEVGKLVSCLHELLGRQHAFAFEVFVGRGELGIEEVFDAVKHYIIFILINNASYYNLVICYILYILLIC